MHSRMSRRCSAALAPIGLAATLAALAVPSASSAATAPPTQTLSANIALSCVVAPGTFNALSAIPATLTATAPTQVAAGQTLALTNVSVTLNVPATLAGDLSAAGAKSASGTLQHFVLDTTGTSAPTTDVGPAAAGGLPFGPATIVANAPLTGTIPSSGTLDVALGTVTGAAGTQAAISVDPTPGYTVNGTSYTATGSGIVATITAVAGTAALPPEPVDCNAPATAVGSVAIVPAGSIPAGTVTTTTYTPAAKAKPKVCYGKNKKGKKIKIACPKAKGTHKKK